MDDDDNHKRRWFHYTIGVKFRGILASGHPKCASAFGPRGERPAVWFSSCSTWERSATRGLVDQRTGENRDMTIAEMVDVGHALVRIEVPESVAPHTWTEYLREGGIDPLTADAIARRADVSRWRLSYHDVPLSAALCVEASVDAAEWIPVSEQRTAGGLWLHPNFLAVITPVVH
jgi:hypothetical protein